MITLSLYSTGISGPRFMCLKIAFKLIYQKRMRENNAKAFLLTNADYNYADVKFKHFLLLISFNHTWLNLKLCF
jgi:hypothetical protein